MKYPRTCDVVDTSTGLVRKHSRVLTLSGVSGTSLLAAAS